jgi:hypothetical protein
VKYPLAVSAKSQAIIVQTHLIGPPCGHVIYAVFSRHIKAAKKQIVPPIVKGFHFCGVELLGLFQKFDTRLRVLK